MDAITGTALKILGIYLLIDCCISLGVRHRELKPDMGQRQWIEFVARFVRGAIGVALILIG